MASFTKRGHITKSVITTASERYHMVSLKGLAAFVFHPAVRAPITVPVQCAAAHSLTVNARPVHRAGALIEEFMLITAAVHCDFSAHQTRLRKNLHALRLDMNRHSSVWPDSEWSG